MVVVAVPGSGLAVVPSVLVLIIFIELIWTLRHHR